MRYLPIIALLFVNCYADDDLAAALKSSTVSGYAKVMYVFDDRNSPKLDQSTYGAGGKIALQTGSWHGLKAKIAYYQTSDLGIRDKNPKKVDAYMFDVDKSPYSIIGEKYIEYQNNNTTLTLGRQEIDTPIVSTYDYRIIPNLFEAYTLTNKDIPNTTATLSYITKMSGLDGLVSFKRFESMSQQTYTSLMMSDYKTIDNSADTLDVSKISGHQALIMTGIVYEKDFKIQAWNYYCKDVLDEFYVDAAYTRQVDKNLALTLEAQAYGVRDIGKFKNFLQTLGLNSSYELFGIKSSLENRALGLTSSLAYNKFTGNQKSVTAFGNWGGYPEYVAVPYMFAEQNSVSAIAKSQMARVAFKFDLSTIGLKNQNLTLGRSLFDIDESIMPNSDIRLTNLIYKAKLTKALSAKLIYELRDSKNYRYDNDMITLSATYTF